MIVWWGPGDAAARSGDVDQLSNVKHILSWSGRNPTSLMRSISSYYLNCRDAVRKAKAQLELKLARDVKNCQKGFFRYINNRQKPKGNIGPLLRRRGELITSNTENAEVLNISLPLSLPALLLSTLGEIG